MHTDRRIGAWRCKLAWRCAPTRLLGDMTATIANAIAGGSFVNHHKLELSARDRC